MQKPSRSDSQFSLLTQRRFGPYFVTQFLGAFNDNVYKNALIALIAFSATATDSSGSGLLVNIAAGVFVLPFFLFSALAGQLADKYENAMLIRRIKIAEIGIMLLAALALFVGSTPALIGVLFLMGTQSAFFGPIKFGILPKHLSASEWMGGNGLVEMGTFLAILLGTIAGTLLVTNPYAPGWALAGGVVVVVALVGYAASTRIPSAAPTDPSLKVNFNPLVETWRLVAYTKKNRVIFQAVLGISWFWMLGALYLAQFPVYARDVLGGTVAVYTLFLGLFSVGIGVGSMLCERLSGHRVEIGLVPFGALGLTVFGLDLFWATPTSPLGVDLGLGAFYAASGTLRLSFDVLMIGVFGGFYIVPLYSLIQQVSKPDRLSRAMACNNIMNAVFMVLSALLGVSLLQMGCTIRQIFLVAAILNALVAAYIFRQVPEFLMRFMAWVLIHSMYRVNKSGFDHIPEHGAVVLASNHISFVDPVIIAGCVRRPIRFVMDHRIYKIPVLHFFFRTAGAIPIASRKEDLAMFDRAFQEMEEAIQNGEIVCIFPEGAITRTGEFNRFRPGIERLIQAEPAPVIPMALQGLWGSFFSRKGGRAMSKWPRKLFSRIGLVVGEPISPEKVTAEGLEVKVLELRGPRL